VAIEGWTQTTAIRAIDLAKRFKDCGLAAVIFTDIQRDGMQTGPNIDQTRQLAQSIDIPVIASGGVSNITDIENLLPLQAVGVTGIITGKALYSGSLVFDEALSLVRKRSKNDG
jgi:phosphoribosylformimino-5-aminoimidazole carboxamide ribotide isomerase